MLKNNLLRAGALTLALVALIVAVPGSRRAMAGSFTAITEYAVRFIQVAPSGLPANCSGNDCIYVSSVDDKAYHKNTSGTAVSLEGGGGASVSITCGTGLSCSPSTITGTGTITNTGGVSWPLENGTSTNTLLYGGTMTGSTIAESHDTTNAYTTGDIAYQNKSAGTADWFIGYPASATIPEFRGVGNNLGFRNVNGDGIVMQAANHVYVYGAGSQMIDFVANNGIETVSGFPLHFATVAAPFQYGAFNWLATPLGSALTSASTITPTTALHHVTGTVSISTIATTNLPTSFGGTLTLICDAACVFATGGNISIGFTGVANSSYDFAWDGTAWRPQGLPAGNVTASGSLTGGVIPVANAAAVLSNGSTGSRATLMGYLFMTPQAAPASPASGDHWVDSTQLALFGFIDAIKQAFVGVIYSADATATVTTTTANQTVIGAGIGAKTLPAAFCAPGKAVRWHVGGVISTGATPGTLTLIIVHGATTIATTGAVTPTVSLTTKRFAVDGVMTYRTCGASGTVTFDGAWTYAGTTTNTINSVDLTNNGSTTTVSTTGTIALDVQATFSATGNTLTGTTATFEILN